MIYFLNQDMNSLLFTTSLQFIAPVLFPLVYVFDNAFTTKIGYLTLNISFKKEGKIMMRSSSGINKWFSLIKVNISTTIGEYSAKKLYFFPSRRKNCEKVSPYFSFSEVENFSKLHFLGQKLSRLAFLGGKIAKIYKFRGKNWKKCIF